MSRRSIMARMDALEARRAQLEGEPVPMVPTVIGGHITPVHAAVLDVMTDLMHMGQSLSSGADTPAHLRVMMRTLAASRGMLLEGIAKVPPEVIREFIGELRDKLGAVLVADDDAPATPGALSLIKPERLAIAAPVDPQPERAASGGAD